MEFITLDRKMIMNCGRIVARFQNVLGPMVVHALPDTIMNSSNITIATRKWAKLGYLVCWISACVILNTMSCMKHAYLHTWSYACTCCVEMVIL